MAEDEREGSASKPWGRSSGNPRTSRACSSSRLLHRLPHSTTPTAPTSPGSASVPGTTHRPSRRPGAAAAAAGLSVLPLAPNGAWAWGAAPRAARRPPSWAAPAVTRRGGRFPQRVVLPWWPVVLCRVSRPARFVTGSTAVTSPKRVLWAPCLASWSHTLRLCKPTRPSRNTCHAALPGASSPCLV